MKKIAVSLIILIMLLSGSAAFGEFNHKNMVLLEDQDGYEISFGPSVEAYQGQENIIVPIRLVSEEEVNYIYSYIEYDASLLAPVTVAPSMFFQHFEYDFVSEGKIELELQCNLLPPPAVDPIPPGDTAFAYIVFDVLAENIDHDLAALLDFAEDINTPFPDNFIMLDNGYFIVPPQLSLTPGSVFIFRPLYGDINLNNMVYEIGDMITFISHLSGETSFTPRQTANSDCNRDGVAATVSDLVYMLNVINGEPDTLLYSPGMPIEPYQLTEIYTIYAPDRLKILDNNYIIHIFLIAEEPLNGFLISLKTPDFISSVGDVALGSNGNDKIVLNSRSNNDNLNIIGCCQGDALSSTGKIHLQIPVTSNVCFTKSDLSVTFKDFSDEVGNMINAEFEVQIEELNTIAINTTEEEDISSDVSIYPNPFNSRVNISYALSQQSLVSVEVFDILGRKVKVLKDGYENAGVQHVSWDGRNSSGRIVSSGMYFCKLRLNSQEQTIKIHFLK